MNRTMLALLREQYVRKKMEEEIEKSQEFVNTKFQDNHGIVVSGGKNTINITFASDGSMKAHMDNESHEDKVAKLALIVQSLESGAQMFCVLKGIVLAKKAGNLQDADAVLRNFFPEGVPMAKPYDVNRIETDLHVQSFTKDVEKWDLDDCPLKSKGMFSKYQFITTQVKNLIEAF